MIDDPTSPNSPHCAILLLLWYWCHLLEILLQPCEKLVSRKFPLFGHPHFFNQLSHHSLNLPTSPHPPHPPINRGLSSYWILYIPPCWNCVASTSLETKGKPQIFHYLAIKFFFSHLSHHSLIPPTSSHPPHAPIIRGLSTHWMLSIPPCPNTLASLSLQKKVCPKFIFLGHPHFVQSPLSSFIEPSNLSPPSTPSNSPPSNNSWIGYPLNAIHSPVPTFSCVVLIVK